MTSEVEGAANVAANQTMDAGVADGQRPQGSDGNVGQGLAKIEAPADESPPKPLVDPATDAAPAVEAQPEEHQAPTVDEMTAKRNEENLQRAIEHGYREEPEPSREERARILVADMEHTVANNGPITLAMMREVRELLGVD